MVCITLSDQVTLNGAVPMSAAVIVADAPGQITPPPLTVAVGSVFTVIVAEPLDVPVQFASLIESIEYVFVAAGLTLREAVVPLLIVCVTLSDQVTFPGAVPGRGAGIGGGPPGTAAAAPPAVRRGRGGPAAGGR